MAAANVQSVVAVMTNPFIFDMVAQRLKDLRHVKQALKSALAKCRETERVDCCHVIEILRETSAAN